MVYYNILMVIYLIAWTSGNGAFFGMFKNQIHEQYVDSGV